MRGAVHLERRAPNQSDALGPYEASLVGNPVADPDKPLEVMRTVHSFDPCLACAIHLVDPKGQSITKVQVVTLRHFRGGHMVRPFSAGPRSRRVTGQSAS